MKKIKNIALTALLLLCINHVAGQVPDGINYQAILRDNTNSELPNEAIDVKFGLITGSAAGTLVWEEQHSTLTNDFGFFSLLIGDVNAIRTGGTLAVYTDIDWAAGPIYLKVSVYQGGAWKDFDPQPLNSLPFSLVSRTSLDNPFGMNADTVTLIDGSLSIGSVNPGRSKLAVISQDDLSEDALFEVKRSDGQTIFAVYNEGVRIFLPTQSTTKGPKGGFAIGGFDRVKGEYTEDYLWVTPDSIRMYFDKTPEGIKGPKGGFAIGGFDRTKANVDNVMLINADSTRFYIDDSGTKGPKGGFAIGGFDRTKGFRQDYMRVTVDSTRIFVNDSTSGFKVSSLKNLEARSFMNITNENYFIGHESGLNITPSGDNGRFNSFLGYQAGKQTVNGRDNLFLGYKSGFSSEANFSVFLGNNSGENSNGDYNLYLGTNSGKNNINGNSNICMGFASGRDHNGGKNVFLGYYSGALDNATIPGEQRIGAYNVFIGSQAGQLGTGSNNLFLGAEAGQMCYGSGNVLIGYRAGYNIGLVDDRLYIDNGTSPSSPLIYGVFTGGSELVRINGDLDYTGALLKGSDINLKKNIEPISGSLEKISSIRGVYFNWDTDKYPELKVDEHRQIGVIAQEIEKVFPELVGKSPEGYKSVDYVSFTAVLLQAVKEQQDMIDKLVEESGKLKNDNQKLRDDYFDLKQEISFIRATINTLNNQ